MVSSRQQASSPTSGALHYSFHVGQNDLTLKTKQSMLSQKTTAASRTSTQSLAVNIADLIGDSTAANPLQQQSCRKNSSPVDNSQAGSADFMQSNSQSEGTTAGFSINNDGPDSDQLGEFQSDDSDDPSNPQLHQDNQEECMPLLEMLGFVKNAATFGAKPLNINYQTFVITSEGGLLGTDVLARFPCVFNSDTGIFFTSLGSTEFQFFTKSTLMNLCNFAEEQRATQLVFLIDRKHSQRDTYRKTLKLVDAKPLSTQEIWELFERGIDDASARRVRAETSFFLMEL